MLKVIGNTEWEADLKVMLCLYRSVVRIKPVYECNVYGELVNRTCQDLRFCLGAFRTSVKRLYVDAHKPSLGARHAKLSLQYTSKIKSLPKHLTHDVVFDSKYMKFFDARPNAIHTFGLHIKQFLTASNTDFLKQF